MSLGMKDAEEDLVPLSDHRIGLHQPRIVLAHGVHGKEVGSWDLLLSNV